MKRERSQSLNPAALTNRTSNHPPTTDTDSLKPTPPSSKNTLEEIVTNTFRTFVQVIIQARSQRLGGHDPTSLSSAQRHDVYSPEASTWLNYYLDCLWAVDDDLAQFWRDWKRNERRSAIDLTLDVFAQLPTSTTAVAAPPPAAGLAGPSRSSPLHHQHHQHHQHQQQKQTEQQPFLLERWQLSFNAKPNVEARHNTINVKKTAMVLRSVGSIVRALPAHKLVRLRRKQPTSFAIEYALYPAAHASLSTPSPACSSHCEWSGSAGRQVLPFSSVVSRTGTFTASVEYATNLPSFKFQALKIEPFVISDYVPSSSDSAATADDYGKKASTMRQPPLSTVSPRRTAEGDLPRGVDISGRSSRERRSLEKGASLPQFLPSSPPPPSTGMAGAPSSSSAIPIRGGATAGPTSSRPRGARSGGGGGVGGAGRGDEEMDFGMMAMMGTSASPPKMSPVFSGGLMSPATDAPPTSTRRVAVAGSAGKNSGGGGSFFNFSSTPPFTRDFFMQQQQQQQQSRLQASPAMTPPFLDNRGSASSPSSEGGERSTSRSLETSGSYSESIFPALLPPADDVGELPALYTNFHASQPAFAVAMQENEVSSFLDSCAHPPDLKMFSQSKNMVASFADELRSLGAEGTEDLETLSRSLRRLSTDFGDGRKRPSKSPSRDNLTDDDPLFFDM